MLLQGFSVLTYCFILLVLLVSCITWAMGYILKTFGISGSRLYYTSALLEHSDVQHIPLAGDSVLLWLELGACFCGCSVIWTTTALEQSLICYGCCIIVEFSAFLFLECLQVISMVLLVVNFARFEFSSRVQTFV